MNNKIHTCFAILNNQINGSKWSKRNPGCMGSICLINQSINQSINHIYTSCMHAYIHACMHACMYTYNHPNIRIIWWNCDLVLWRLVSWDRFLISISYKSNYDINLISQDIGLENCSLSNRLLNIETEGSDQGLTMTSSPYVTKEAKDLCHKSLRQSWTCHLFIKICAPRAPSEYKETLFTSIMWYNYISMQYMYTTC